VLRLALTKSLAKNNIHTTTCLSEELSLYAVAILLGLPRETEESAPQLSRVGTIPCDRGAVKTDWLFSAPPCLRGESLSVSPW